MPKINKTKFAILGVLSTKSCSGYDIKKYCDQSISHFWNENFGHIYPVLKQMEAEALITKEVEHTEGKPSKNIYDITEKGKAVLNEWLLLPDEQSPARLEFLLKIFFSENVPIEKTIEKLVKGKAGVQNNLSKYLAIEKELLKSYESTQNQSVLFQLATVRFGISNAKAMIEWAEQTIKEMQVLHKI